MCTDFSEEPATSIINEGSGMHLYLKDKSCGMKRPVVWQMCTDVSEESATYIINAGSGMDFYLRDKSCGT